TRCSFAREAEGGVIRLAGSWRLSSIGELDEALRALGIGPGGLAGPVALDGAALAEIDTAAALLVWRHLAAAGVSPEAVSVRRFADAHARILEMVRQRLKGLEPAAAPRPRGPLASLGAATADLLALLH